MGAAEKGRKRATEITLSLYAWTLGSRIALDERMIHWSGLLGFYYSMGAGLEMTMRSPGPDGVKGGAG